MAARDDGNDILKLCIDELTEREVLYAERYGSVYMISAGSHVFNIVNKEKKLFVVQSILADTRIHVFMVTPSGYGKTFHIRHFIDPYGGILVGVLPVEFEGPMTEAAWVGTVKFHEGEPVTFYGAAYEYRYHIVGVEEFSAIVEMMHSSHSRMLAPQLLTSLDSGIVRKRLGGSGAQSSSRLAYETAVTLWTGDRPATFDLSSGMARRLTFLNFFPTRKEIELMRDDIRKGYGRRYNPARVEAIKTKFKERIEEVKKLKELTFSSNFWETLDKLKPLGVQPYEEIIYTRLMIGYNILSHPVKDILNIEVDKELFEILQRVAAWQKQIKRGADISQIISIIEDYGGVINRRILQDKLSDFGIFWDQSSSTIDRLIRTGVLRWKKDDEGHVYLALR